MGLASEISKIPDAWLLLRFCHFMREKADRTFYLLSSQFPFPSALIYPVKTSMMNSDLPYVAVLCFLLFMA